MGIMTTDDDDDDTAVSSDQSRDFIDWRMYRNMFQRQPEGDDDENLDLIHSTDRPEEVTRAPLKERSRKRKYHETDLMNDVEEPDVR